MNTNKSMHSEMGLVWQNPIQRIIRTAYLSVLITAQLQYTIQHRTVLMISPLTSRQTSQLRCCLSKERGLQFWSIMYSYCIHMWP